MEKCLESIKDAVKQGRELREEILIWQERQNAMATSMIARLEQAEKSCRSFKSKEETFFVLYYNGKMVNIYKTKELAEEWKDHYQMVDRLKGKEIGEYKIHPISPVDYEPRLYGNDGIETSILEPIDEQLERAIDQELDQEDID